METRGSLQEKSLETLSFELDLQMSQSQCTMTLKAELCWLRCPAPEVTSAGVEPRFARRACGIGVSALSTGLAAAAAPRLAAYEGPPVQLGERSALGRRAETVGTASSTPSSSMDDRKKFNSCLRTPRQFQPMALKPPQQTRLVIILQRRLSHS